MLGDGTDVDEVSRSNMHDEVVQWMRKIGWGKQYRNGKNEEYLRDRVTWRLFHCGHPHRSATLCRTHRHWRQKYRLK